MTGFIKFLIFLLIFIFSDFAYSASFNCDKARSKNEHLICGDKELSKLDDALGVIYKQAKINTKNKKAFRARTIKEWKRRERECDGEKDCLLDWYGFRFEELSSKQMISGKVYLRERELVNGDLLPFVAMITNKKVKIYSNACNGFVSTNDIQLLGNNLNQYKGKKKTFYADCFCGLHHSHVRDITCNIIR